ncbi:MAG: DEAD/DEAH box helicase [Thaumarchaeota archaeon]|nr:DEAD/DEAH box helicase [Nitrososphaerota archaeon]
MKFTCPACDSGMELSRTFDGRMHVSCSGCELQDLVAYNSNPDESFLEFLVRYDEGGPPGAGAPDAAKAEATAAETAGSPPESPNAGDAAARDMVRPESEIEGMIGDESPDKLMRDILYSKKDYVADYRVIREAEPEYGPSPDEAGLDCRLAAALKESGIGRLYRFQYDAIKSITSGRDTVIEAPTASGKTEAFLIPVIQRVTDAVNGAGDLHGGAGSDDNAVVVVGGRAARRIHAIITYPTKALARDQLPKIRRLSEAAGLSAEAYDGDTDAPARRRIVSRPPHILVTNFDLLHYHMWRRTHLGRMLRTVRIIVVDEAHAYSGIFGSNVHHIIRRLARIAGGSGGSGRPQYVAASATLDDPGRFCADLFGIDDIATVRGGGRGRSIEFAMLFPSLRSPRVLMSHLTKRFAASGRQTMVFSNSHRNAELLAIYCQRGGVRIKVHRAGLLPGHRVAIENEFREGSLQAVSCTPTLELGIDVGGTDCVVSAPSPINRLIQRIGRAARSEGRRGYAFLALGNDPISQYYRNHPGDYFEDTEKLYIDPKNPYVEECQILAMAHDMPIVPEEEEEEGPHAEVIRRHISQGRLRRAGGAIVPGGSGGAAAGGILDKYSIRGMGESIDITTGGRKVADRVCPIALEELHEGAVYFLAGRPYGVTEFDYPKRQHAVIEELPRDHPYYTRALTSEYPGIEEVVEKRMVNGIEAAFCRLRIKKTVTGYVKINWMDIGRDGAGDRYGDEDGVGIGSDGAAMAPDPVELDRPLEYTYVTKGIVFCAPSPDDTIQRAADEMRRNVTGQGMQGQGQGMRERSATVPGRLEEGYIMTSGYHATEHVVIEGSNMITGGASRNLGGISMGSSGMIFVHDGVIGGSGASRALYDRLETAFERGARIVGECPCTAESGCPRCTMSYRCGNNNQYLHKAAALEVFERINGGQATALLDSFEGCSPIV